MQQKLVYHFISSSIFVGYFVTLVVHVHVSLGAFLHDRPVACMISLIHSRVLPTRGLSYVVNIIFISECVLSCCIVRSRCIALFTCIASTPFSDLNGMPALSVLQIDVYLPYLTSMSA
jgi:hypothetical protein